MEFYWSFVCGIEAKLDRFDVVQKVLYDEFKSVTIRFLGAESHVRDELQREGITPLLLSPRGKTKDLEIDWEII